jgi:hypothetical protein
MPRKLPRTYKKGAPGSEYEDMNARRQSRRAVEKKIGRKLKTVEQVDHKNSNPQSKDLSNLKVVSMKENLAKQQAVDNKRPRRASLRKGKR